MSYPIPRKIDSIITGQPVIEGAGVHLKRIFGFHNVERFDPFLMLDDFRSDRPEDYRKGFPWHPHRGIETITYVLKGNVEHGDSLGNKGVISSGDVQWMTAGSGIIHQEMPKGDDHGAMHGFQLWANLPSSHKMMEPRYRDILFDDIPEVNHENGTRVRIVAGSFGGVTGPANDIIIDPEYLDCTVLKNTSFTHKTTRGYTVLLYMIEGNGLVDKRVIVNGELVLFQDGDECHFTTGNNTQARFLLLSGKPLKETVAWRGPIVMNSQEELDQAFAELEADTFIKHK